MPSELFKFIPETTAGHRCSGLPAAKAALRPANRGIGVNSNHTSINAEAQLGDDDSIFNYYRRLIALRKTYDVIAYGDFKPLDVRHPSVFAYKRTYGNETLFVVCNFYGKPLTWESANRLKDAAAFSAITKTRHLSAYSHFKTV